MPQEVRVDKWVWAMRIYPTRSRATEACHKGRVTINGVVAKPSKTVKPGDKVGVRKPPVTFTYEVLQVTENRLGAKKVPDYMVDVTTPDQKSLLDMARIGGFINRQKGLGRPTKRDAREIDHFTEEFSSDWEDFDWDDDEEM